MSTAYTLLIGRNSCGFLDYCDISSSIWFLHFIQPQKCLTVKMEAARAFEASGTVPNPTRTEPSAHISNTADRTCNQATISPADRTWQFLYRCCPPNHVSAVQFQCKHVSDSSVDNVWCLTLFIFISWNLYSKQLSAWCVLKELATCCPTRYANPPVWLVFHSHTIEIEEMSEVMSKKTEKIYRFVSEYYSVAQQCCII